MTILAATGRTLLCTIHQPSYSIFQKFDTLLLLSHGYLVYSGPVSSCCQYFEKLGYPSNLDTTTSGTSSSSMNPAEYVITLLTKLPETGPQSIQSLATEIEKKWESIDTTSSTTTTAPTPALVCSPSDLFYSCKITLQLIYILLHREILKESRRLYFWLIFYFRSLLLGIAIGGVWYNISCDGLAIVERLGLFLTIYLLTSLWLTEFIPTLHYDKIIFYREKESNTITIISSWFIHGLIPSILFSIAILILTLPIYYMTDLQDNNILYHYIIFYITIYLGLITNLSINHILIYLLPNYMIHILIFPGVSLAVQSLLSGYAVLPSTIMLYIRWIIYINPCFLVMNSLFVNEFKNNKCADSFQNNYQYYEEGFSYTIPQRKVIFYLLLMICVTRVIAYMAMRWINFTRA